MSATIRQDGGGLMHRAELAAKQVVCEWIRKTLRETFLQALQQAWSVKENQVIEISSEGLQESLDAVERVSQAWQESLRQAEQESVSDWLQEVFDNGKDTCWSDVETNDDFSNENTTMQLQNALPDEEAPERTNGDLLNSSTEEEVGEEASPNPNNKAHHSMTEVPYCKLRSLGKRSHLGEPYLSTKDAIVQLQGMGQSGESYWPFDSNMLDQACAEIPNRMRCEQQNDNNTDNNLSYQIIPKSVWEKKQQHQQEMARDSSATSGPATDLTTTTTVIDGSQIVESTPQTTALLTRLLERNGRNVGSTDSENNVRQVARKRAEPPEEPCRPPSDVTMSSHRVRDELSAGVKQRLDQLLHNEDDKDASVDASPPPLVLFGALKKVGDIHYKLQQRIKDDSTRNNKEALPLSDKQARRQQRASIQERLDPHRILKNHDIQKYRSRILRTEDWHDETKKYFDMDLGWCLLEVRKSNGKKRLLCFSSLEISLEDRREEEEDTGLGQEDEIFANDDVGDMSAV